MKNRKIINIFLMYVGGRGRTIEGEKEMYMGLLL